MRRYTFEVILHEGSDEFWETDPTDHDVTLMLIEALELYGLLIQRPSGYELAADTVRLIKMEIIS